MDGCDEEGEPEEALAAQLRLFCTFLANFPTPFPDS